MSPCRPVFRCLLPLLFTLGFCGTIFADGGQNEESGESVKMPNPLGRVVADDELACEAACADCASAADERSASESLLWLRAPLLGDFSIEALYPSEMGESQKGATLRMQRAVFGGENLALWERDESEPDLFAELASGESGFAESALGHFALRGKTDSAIGTALSVVSAFRSDTGGLIFAQQNFPTADFGGTAGAAPVVSSALASSAAPAASFSPAFGAQSAPTFGGGFGGGHWSAGSGTDARLGGVPSYKPVNEEGWWEIVSAAPTKNNVLTDDRFLASIRLDGVGQTWDKEGHALGKVIDLNGYSLTFTMGGILSDGERLNWIHNGTLATMGDNFEVHVIGGVPGTGVGGLEISAVLANGAGGATGLIKNGDGELILSGGANTFKGDVHIESGTLTLRASGGNGVIPGQAIYVGDGTSRAVLALKGGIDAINPLATVTLRGSESAPAVLRLEKTDSKEGVSQTLRKLVIEGNGVIDFSDGGSPSPNALYIDQLDLEGGELTIRGWDQYQTQLFINYTGMPDSVLLSKLHIEGYDNLRVSRDGIGYWSIAADPIPEPATCGAIAAAGACALVAWRRGRRTSESAQ